MEAAESAMWNLNSASTRVFGRLKPLLGVIPSIHVQVRTRKDAVLWLWRKHNVVNARIMKEEADKGAQHGMPMPYYSTPS